MSNNIITRDEIVAWILTYALAISENRVLLTELDAAIGDGDHGANMDRGFKAVSVRLQTGGADISQVLKTTGITLLSTIGGAGGPLYSTIFLQAAQSCTGKTQLTLQDWIAMMDSAMKGVIARGKAAMGDKTMLDALIPAVQALKDTADAGLSLADALHASSEAAENGMQATIPLVARKGRASYLGERSVGHIDPGATSTHLLFKTAAATLAQG
jgi:dihydroxyacetone kinase-like protein